MDVVEVEAKAMGKTFYGAGREESPLLLVLPPLREIPRRRGILKKIE